jgi:hypothetical protein
MSGWSALRWTGVLGLASIALHIVGYVFLIGGAPGTPPPIEDANKWAAYVKDSHVALTTAAILIFIGIALFIGFLAGLRAIAVAAAPAYEWLATTALGAGVAISAIAYVTGGLGVAASAIAVSSHADASQVRLVSETYTVVGGAPFVVQIALFMVTAGSLVAATRFLPRWLAWLGWIGSVVALVTAFSAYGPSDPNAFWSANGSVTILAVLPFWAWIVGASVVFLRRRV